MEIKTRSCHGWSEAEKKLFLVNMALNVYEDAEGAAAILEIDRKEHTVGEIADMYVDLWRSRF